MNKIELTMKESLIALFFSIPAVIWKGFVLCKLWVWFVMPLLGIPLTIPIAIGLMLIRSFIIYEYGAKAEIPEDSNLLKLIISWGIHPAVVLGFGALIHLFV